MFTRAPKRGWDGRDSCDSLCSALGIITCSTGPARTPTSSPTPPSRSPTPAATSTPATHPDPAGHPHYQCDDGGLPRREVTSHVWCWEAPLEGCAPSQAQADRDDGIGSE